MRFRSLRKIESEQMEKVGQYTHPEERFVRCSFQFRLDGSSYLNVLMWPVTSNHNTAIHFPVSVSRFFFLSVCFKRNYWCIRAFATVSRPIFIRFYCGFSYRLFSLCILHRRFPSEEWVMIPFFSLSRCSTKYTTKCHLLIVIVTMCV